MPASPPTSAVPPAVPVPEAPLPAEPFAAFAARLGAQIEVDLSAAATDDLLREDLGLDSLAMAEALLLLADDGVDLPTDLIPELRTLGDLHHYATVLAPRVPPAGGPGEAGR